MTWITVNGQPVFAIGYEPEMPERCQLCGKKAELRPYGPNDEWICHACGMKDEKTTLKKFRERTSQ